MLQKIIKASAVAIAIASIGVAIYGWLDTAVSLDHARQQQRTEEERNDLLRTFLLALNQGAKRAEIEQVVRSKFTKGHVVKEEKGSILVDDVVFEFDDTGTLSQVRFLNAVN